MDICNLRRFRRDSLLRFYNSLGKLKFSYRVLCRSNKLGIEGFTCTSVYDDRIANALMCPSVRPGLKLP